MTQNSIHVAHKNSAEQLEKHPEPNIREEKAREVGEIWDVMSQTVETKNITGS
jgi:hypothetical protein